MSRLVEDVRRLKEDLCAGGWCKVGVMGMVVICLLLALVQFSYGGYQLGAGNQPIQITFLKKSADPTLFASDEMVRQTMPQYTTMFFRALSPLLKEGSFFEKLWRAEGGWEGGEVESLYLVLQLLTGFLTLLAVYFLGRSIFGRGIGGWGAIAAVCLMVAGHHRGLTVEGIYTPFFTHTLAALPVGLVALGLAYRGRTFWAMVLTGALFNLHALTAVYVLLMVGAATLADMEGERWKDGASWWRWCKSVLLGGAAFGLLALPTLLQMVATRGQVFDAAWLNLMRVRSAEHSFPSTWWAMGNVGIPRFTLIFALFVLSWSFLSGRALRVTLWMTAAVGLLFAVGYVFSEIWPTAIVVRLQPFRASRVLMVLMLAHIAYGAVRGIVGNSKFEIRNSNANPSSNVQDSNVQNSELLHAFVPAPSQTAGFWGWVGRVMEVVAGVMVLGTLAVPAWMVLLPEVVVVVVMAALVSGRLSKVQAGVAVGALVVAFLGWKQIHFSIPLFSSDVMLSPRLPEGWSLMMLVVAVIVGTLLALSRPIWLRAVVIGLSLMVVLMCSLLTLEQALDRAKSPTNQTNQMRGVSQWAKYGTPKDTVFLTPTGFSAFRIFSERGLVGDWRDGTQLYFASGFAGDWISRLKDLEPGLMLSPDGGKLVARGRSLATLDDDELIKLAEKYKAGYVVLPTPEEGKSRTLEVAFSDANFTAYLPKVLTTIPEGVINADEWLAMEKFMATTVAQNIEQHRKAAVTVQIVEPSGRPVQDLVVELKQVRHAFHFGCSLGFFPGSTIRKYADQQPPEMTAKEMELIPTLFNASMMPFAGKWMCIEPKDGERDFTELDKYMAYCREHNIAVEFHFFTGLLPRWLLGEKGAELPLAFERLPGHARELVERYGDQVAFWQVVNNYHLIKGTPAIFREMKEKYPNMKLGMGACVKFWSGSRDAARREASMYQNFKELLWVKEQGVQPDFYAIHGHSPPALWADPRTMYEVFDRYAKEGLKVHVTEVLVPVEGDLAGDVRKGKWSPELQAEYFERFFTICFSHPEVELINLWGIGAKGWGGSGGLLDAEGNPRPAWYRLEELLKRKWNTRVEVQLPLDGVVQTRAFHGTYRLTVKLRDGREVVTELAVPEGRAAAFKYCLDEKAGTLVPMTKSE